MRRGAFGPIRTRAGGWPYRSCGTGRGAISCPGYDVDVAVNGAHPVILSSTRCARAASERGLRPRSDFEVLAHHIRGRIMYPEGGSPAVMTLEEKLRGGVAQAVRPRRASASVYVSFSERVGIPLS